MSDAGSDKSELPLKTLILQLRDDGVAFLRAQAEFFTLEAQIRAKSLVIWIAVGLIALALVAGALVAFLLGAMMVLQPYVGTGTSVALVTLTTLLLACCLGFVAVGRIKRAFKP